MNDCESLRKIDGKSELDKALKHWGAEAEKRFGKEPPPEIHDADWPFPPGHRNRQRRNRDWSLLNGQVVGAKNI